MAEAEDCESMEFDAFVAAYYATLVRYAFLLCQDNALAEDLVQEALVGVHRRWNRVRQMDNPRAYTRRAVTNQHLSWRRRRVSTEIVKAEPGSSAGLDATERVDDQEEMWQVLSGLSARQRAALVLRYYTDLSDADIATALGCRPATVRSLIARGLGALRAMTPAEQTVPKPTLGGNS